MTFKELDKKDLKAVRLVSPLWRDIAAELLFDRIWISHRQADIEIFNAWTKNHRCSAFVKTLMYDASYLDPSLKLCDYAQYLCEQLDRINPLYPEERDYKNCDPKIQELFYYFWGGKKLNKREQKATTAELFDSGRFSRDREHWLNLRKASNARIRGFDIVREGFAEYTREANMERDLHDRSPHLCIYVNRGIERLPRLQSVSFWEHNHSDWHRIEQFDPLHPKPFFLDGPPFIRSWNPLYVLPRSHLHELDDLGKMDRGLATQFGLCRRFISLMSAVALSQTKLSHFEIESDQFHFEPLETDLTRDCILSRNIRTVFSSLESLQIHVLRSDYLPEYDRFFGLQPILSTATNLAYLSLRGSRNIPKDEELPKCVFKSAFPKKAVLTKLRRLVLCKFHFKARHLVKFLRRHKLNRLELDSDIVRVEGTDHMADVRTICKAVSSVPHIKITEVETLDIVGNPGDKYLVLETDDETHAVVVKLAMKNNMGLGSQAQRVVDLNEAWEDVKEYGVGVQPKHSPSPSEFAMALYPLLYEALDLST